MSGFRRQGRDARPARTGRAHSCAWAAAGLGFGTLAASAAPSAAVLGRRDGRIARGLAHAVGGRPHCPVSADLEGGLGPSAQTVTETIHEAEMGLQRRRRTADLRPRPRGRRHRGAAEPRRAAVPLHADRAPRSFLRPRRWTTIRRLAASAGMTCCSPGLPDLPSPRAVCAALPVASPAGVRGRWSTRRWRLCGAWPRPPRSLLESARAAGGPLRSRPQPRRRTSRSLARALTRRDARRIRGAPSAGPAPKKSAPDRPAIVGITAPRLFGLAVAHALAGGLAALLGLLARRPGRLLVPRRASAAATPAPLLVRRAILAFCVASAAHSFYLRAPSQVAAMLGADAGGAARDGPGMRGDRRGEALGGWAPSCPPCCSPPPRVHAGATTPRRPRRQVESTAARRGPAGAAHLSARAALRRQRPGLPARALTELSIRNGCSAAVRARPAPNPGPHRRWRRDAVLPPAIRRPGFVRTCSSRAKVYGVHEDHRPSMRAASALVQGVAHGAASRRSPPSDARGGLASRSAQVRCWRSARSPGLGLVQRRQPWRRTGRDGRDQRRAQRRHSFCSRCG